MDRTEKVVALKHSGNNCCQAVLLAYADKLDLSEKDLQKIGSTLGLGMGNMQGPCGALLAAEIVQGLLLSSGNAITPLAKNLQESFVEKTGALICKDIKGTETGKMLRSCDDCCRNAVACLKEQGL